jgi:hypothetical protein
MNLLSLVDPRLDNIYQIRRKWYIQNARPSLHSLFFFLHSFMTHDDRRFFLITPKKTVPLQWQCGAGNRRPNPWTQSANAVQEWDLWLSSPHAWMDDGSIRARF